MATYETAFYATQDPDRVNTSRLPAANIASGDIEVCQVSYALSSGTEEIANDIINLAILPVGAILVPALCSVLCADPGTTLTLDVGYADNPDAYADGIVLSSGGRVEFTSGTAPSGMVPEAMTTGTLIATVASAGTLTDAVVLYFTIAYKRPKG